MNFFKEKPWITRLFIQEPFSQKNLAISYSRDGRRIGSRRDQKMPPHKNQCSEELKRKKKKRKLNNSNKIHKNYNRQ